MANPDDKFASSSVETTPETQCREGYVVIYRFHTKDYACVTESTAELWKRHGIGENPAIAEIINEEELKNETEKELENEINDINQQIIVINEEYTASQIELKDLYDTKYQNVDILAKIDEKQILKNYLANKTMTKKELSDQILAIRNQTGPMKENILDEKLQALDELKIDFDNKILEITKEYEGSLEIEIIWNSDISNYQAVKKANESE